MHYVVAQMLMGFSMPIGGYFTFDFFNKKFFLQQQIHARTNKTKTNYKS